MLLLLNKLTFQDFSFNLLEQQSGSAFGFYRSSPSARTAMNQQCNFAVLTTSLVRTIWTLKYCWKKYSASPGQLIEIPSITCNSSSITLGLSVVLILHELALLHSTSSGSWKWLGGEIGLLYPAGVMQTRNDVCFFI